MARLNEVSLPRALSPLRLILILIFLLSVTGGLVYLFGMPLRMVYWGVYGRMRPMVSEQDLLRQGKEVPGGVQALRDMFEDSREATRQGDVILQSADSGGGGAGDDAAAEAASKEQQEEQPSGQQQEDPAGGGQAAAVGDSAPVTGGNRAHALTKEMVAKVAQDNAVMVTWANYHYRDFVVNWVEHLQAAGCNAFIVGAMDDKLLEYLLEKKVPTFSMSSGLSLDDFGWGTPTFHKMGREKINLIYSFTKMGFDVLISDVDTVWMRNPLPYVQQYPEADILTSSDHLINTVADEGLEVWPNSASAANIGIMLFRPKGHDLAAEWVDLLEKDSSIWDQNGFNDLFRRGSRPLPDRADRLFECYDGKLKCGILPVSLFCSGHTGFTQDMPGKLGLKPYVIHATFQFSGTPGKRHRMRERLMWKDGPEYFTEPAAGFIAWDYDVPAPLLAAAKNVQRDFTLQATHPHFALVNYQLKQLRAAFALAQITGRAVILPRLMCGMDRWWAPHDGTIPGSGLEIPYACPADHVLDLESMSRQQPDSDFGPHIEFREYSFLERPQAATLSTVVLTVCQDGAAGCTEGANGGATDKLQPQLNEAQLKVALMEGAAAKAKVLRISGGIDRLFKGWSDDAAAQRFKRRLDGYASIWCCVNAHPGHVWYDFFFDQPPHTDRHGRMINGTVWEPLTGP